MKKVFSLIAIAAVIAGSSVAQPQLHTQHTGQKPASAMKMPMMDMKKCMADMKAGQKRMDELVAAMNAADGVDKSAATTAVVAEMASQQKMMGEMCAMMMEHMGSMPMMNMGSKPAKGHSKAAGHTGHHGK